MSSIRPYYSFLSGRLACFKPSPAPDSPLPQITAVVMYIALVTAQQMLLQASKDLHAFLLPDDITSILRGVVQLYKGTTDATATIQHAASR